ncbi:MAG: NAD(P)/FAD-dependent oxidoreductase [Acidobacteriaceae bacterium]
MNRFVRRLLVGAVAGGVAGLPALLTGAMSGGVFAFGILAGALFAASIRPTRGAYVDNMMTGASLGIPLWGIVNVIVLPLMSGGHMTWDAAEMQNHFAGLFAWVLFGALFGVMFQAFSDAAVFQFGPEIQPSPKSPSVVKRIVILGGGFGGMKTAEWLEKQFAGEQSVSITLISETNALLFTPMLAEVAGSSLEPSHISAPLRSSLRQTAFVRGHVTDIDLERRKVLLDGGGLERAESAPELEYDHLVLALGAVSNYLGMANVERLAFNFKSLFDAIRIRNHVIEMFERADREQDSAVRKKLLTFVIAGGGFAGVELAGALNDFTHGILADYRNLQIEELAVILVHSRDRILPELSDSLASYAMQKLEQRGVTFRLNTRLKDAAAGLVTLSDGQIACETLVWTAGTTPNPLLKNLAVAKDKRGAVVVDSTLAVPQCAGVWALGDCAAVNDGKTGKPCPPTAQFALREAETIATNIRAALRGLPGKRFHFDSLGALCVIGHQTACAELTVPFARSRSLRFSGLLAWLMWRGIYLSKLPGLERKIRVLMAWNLELFFPRDIIQTIELEEQRDHDINTGSRARNPA